MFEKEKIDSRLLNLNDVLKWKIFENNNSEDLEERERKAIYIASLNSGDEVLVDWYDDPKSNQMRHNVFVEYNKPTNILIVIDMQNDFITGSLGSKDAQSIIPNMCKYINEYNGKIYFTQDSHNIDYLVNTLEGKYLPVEHCIRGKEGHRINSEIMKSAETSKSGFEIIEKETFGFTNWKNLFSYYCPNNPSKITLIGVCTDICVVSNALILRALYPNTEIQVIPELCAGTTKEAHDAALKVMQSCQIEIKHLEK